MERLLCERPIYSLIKLFWLPKKIQRINHFCGFIFLSWAWNLKYESLVLLFLYYMNENHINPFEWPFMFLCELYSYLSFASVFPLYSHQRKTEGFLFHFIKLFTKQFTFRYVCCEKPHWVTIFGFIEYLYIYTNLSERGFPPL